MDFIWFDLTKVFACVTFLVDNKQESLGTKAISSIESNCATCPPYCDSFLFTVCIFLILSRLLNWQHKSGVGVIEQGATKDGITSMGN